MAHVMHLPAPGGRGPPLANTRKEFHTEITEDTETGIPDSGCRRTEGGGRMRGEDEVWEQRADYFPSTNRNNGAAVRSAAVSTLQNVSQSSRELRPKAARFCGSL